MTGHGRPSSSFVDSTLSWMPQLFVHQGQELPPPWVVGIVFDNSVQAAFIIWIWWRRGRIILACLGDLSIRWTKGRSAASANSRPASSCPRNKPTGGRTQSSGECAGWVTGSGRLVTCSAWSSGRLSMLDRVSSQSDVLNIVSSTLNGADCTSRAYTSDAPLFVWWCPNTNLVSELPSLWLCIHEVWSHLHRNHFQWATDPSPNLSWGSWPWCPSPLSCSEVGGGGKLGATWRSPSWPVQLSWWRSCPRTLFPNLSVVQLTNGKWAPGDFLSLSSSKMQNSLHFAAKYPKWSPTPSFASSITMLEIWRKSPNLALAKIAKRKTPVEYRSTVAKLSSPNSDSRCWIAGTVRTDDCFRRGRFWAAARKIPATHALSKASIWQLRPTTTSWPPQIPVRREWVADSCLRCLT